MRRTPIGTAIQVVPLMWGLVALTSLFFCFGDTLSAERGWALFKFPYFQWVTAFQYWGKSWWVMTWILVSAVPSAVLSFAVAGWIVRRGFVRPQLPRMPWETGPRKVREATTANHGTARFMTPAEARRAFPGGYEYGGLAVAALTRLGKPLIDNRSRGSGHSMDISGSDAGKTRKAILDMFLWLGSAVVLDPKCRIGPMVRTSLEDDGFRVILLDPNDETVGFNAIDWIDIENDRLAEQHVRTVVSWVFGDEPKDLSGNSAFFLKTAKSLCECLLSHALWEPGWDASLWDMRDGIENSGTDLMKVLTHIHHKSHSQRAKKMAGTFLVGKALETFENIHQTAQENTSWLSMSAYVDMVCGNSFKTSDIHGKEKVRVFVQIPMDSLITSPGVARVCIGAFMNAMIQARGRGHQKAVLFLLDETVLLGRLKVLELARSQGREYGIRMHMIWQSMWQISQVFDRDGMDAWLDGVDYRMYSEIGALHTAEAISKEMGKRGVLATSEGANRSRASNNGRSIFGWSNSSNMQLNEHEIGADLMTPDAIMRLPKGQVIVLSKGNYPLLGWRPLWHNYPQIVARVEELEDEPAQPAQLVAQGNRVGPTDPTPAEAGSGPAENPGPEADRNEDAAAA